MVYVKPLVLMGVLIHLMLTIPLGSNMITPVRIATQLEVTLLCRGLKGGYLNEKEALVKASV